MRSRLYIILAQYRLFWKTKAWLNQVLFWLRARIFRIKRTINEEKSNVKPQIHFLSIARGQIFWALITLLLLHTIDPYLSFFYIWLDWGLLDNDETYITLLATISGVGGIFIGLYYTASSGPQKLDSGLDVISA